MNPAPTSPGRERLYRGYHIVYDAPTILKASRLMPDTPTTDPVALALALEPFAAYAEARGECEDGERMLLVMGGPNGPAQVTLGDFRRAAEAYRALKEAPPPFPPELVEMSRRATPGVLSVTLVPGSYQRPALVQSGDKVIASCNGNQLDPGATSIREAEANAELIAALVNWFREQVGE